jgi:hypothetical protein
MLRYYFSLVAWIRILTMFSMDSLVPLKYLVRAPFQDLPCFNLSTACLFWRIVLHNCKNNLYFVNLCHKPHNKNTSSTSNEPQI